jgi:hypothetical protein
MFRFCFKHFLLFLVIGCQFGKSLADNSPPSGSIQNLFQFSNENGSAETYSASGYIDLTNPFFTDGANGRTCASCHQPSDGMSISTNSIQARFNTAYQIDPLFSSDTLFNVSDAANCNNIQLNASSSPNTVSQAYSLLLNYGLIRVGLGLSTDADFTLSTIADPYSCQNPSTNTISVYRRPLPATNLKFLSALMWDERESNVNTGNALTSSNDLTQLPLDLQTQIVHAFQKHATTSSLTTLLSSQQIASIFALEFGLNSAQGFDEDARSLSARGASGGALALSRQTFTIGVNDPAPFLMGVQGATFNSNVFQLFNSWLKPGKGNADMAAIARGQNVFNTKQFTISGVKGFNDMTSSSGSVSPIYTNGTCSVCHNSPNIGNHSVSASMNTGVADPHGTTNIFSPDSYLPVFTFCQNGSANNCIQTTDPGKALTSKLFNDIGKFRIPVLRSLSSRAPYFHNGSAQTLDDVIGFYVNRFGIQFNGTEREDLEAFLGAL